MMYFLKLTGISVVCTVVAATVVGGIYYGLRTFNNPDAEKQSDIQNKE